MHVKRKSVLDDIAALILTRFMEPPHRARVQCGIIYCLSRAECERVADDLRERLGKAGKRLAIRCPTYSSLRA